jgi:hypothetical protein
MLGSRSWITMFVVAAVLAHSIRDVEASFAAA